MGIVPDIYLYIKTVHLPQSKQNNVVSNINFFSSVQNARPKLDKLSNYYG